MTEAKKSDVISVAKYLVRSIIRISNAWLLTRCGRYNVLSEFDVKALQDDVEWLERFRESVSILLEAWGWDIARLRRIEPLQRDQGWSNWDVCADGIIYVCRFTETDSN